MSWSRNTHGVLLWKLEQHVAQFFIVQNSEVMTGLLEVKNTMSSLQIAELTGKAHSNVMRDIRNILEQLEDRGAFNFELTSYIDKSNRESPCYQLTKKDCLLLASGYDANLRAKIINRWEELETRELSRKELALMVIQAEEEKERLALENEKQQKQIEKLQPKADFAEAAFKAEGKVDIGQAAKILGLPFGRNTLFKKLKEKGIFFKRNEPKQKYVDAGYFELTQLPPIHRNNHPDLIVMKVICTQKGLAYINHLFGGKPSDGKLARIV